MSDQKIDVEGSKEVYWLADSDINKPYGISTYLRVMKIEKFIKDVEKEHKIVGLTFEDNLLGFILDEKRPNSGGSPSKVSEKKPSGD